MELWEALVNLVRALGHLVTANAAWLGPALLLFIWVAWWLWGVHWPTLWRRLGEGAWAPFVLLMITAALVWSQIAPSASYVLGFLIVPNFWWQLGAMALLVGVALFCGWLQGYFGWVPAEVELGPPVHGHDDAHGHAHPDGTLHGHEPAGAAGHAHH